MGTAERVDLTCFIPFAEDGNLGPVWNRVMERLPEESWACILDHDAMFTTPVWYRQITAAIKQYPEGTFSCLSNRIGQESRWQSVSQETISKDEHDIREHRIVGAELAQNRKVTDVTQETHLMAGMMFVMSKETWKLIGPFPNGLRGLDNWIHHTLRAKGRKMYCIEGLYVYHWYRADGRNHVAASLAHHFVR